MFGHVVEGERYVDQVEQTSVDSEHKPYSDFRIVDCGIVPGFGVQHPEPIVPPPAAPVMPVLPPSLSVLPISMMVPPDLGNRDTGAGES